MSELQKKEDRMTDTSDCSKCAIRLSCDTAYTGNCWLTKEYEEQSEYLVKKLDMIKR